MMGFIFKRKKHPDIRSSSIERDSFIHSVEKYLESRPDIVYDDSAKKMLVDWFVNHEDSKIEKYLGTKL